VIYLDVVVIIVHNTIRRKADECLHIGDALNTKAGNSILEIN
jgi:hypothetical protein